MHRRGSDPQNMEPTDFLCDFCERPWSEATPFIEGHHGSCLCSECLVQAINAMRGGAAAEPPAGIAAAAVGAGSASTGACTMCLEQRDDLRWRSPKRDAAICDRCIEQASRVLSKDRASGWSPPAA